MMTMRINRWFVPLALSLVGGACSSGDPGSVRSDLARMQGAITTCKVDDDCASSQSCCGGACVNQESDPGNCGGCGVRCALGATCEGGACACPDPKRTCSGRCVDQGTDRYNCGGCGIACATNGKCEGGRCTCPDVAPSRCGSTCVDLDKDEANCGGCGAKCTGGKSCVAGACDCAADQEVCGDMCVDTRVDAKHCGGCFTECTDGYKCVEGSCTCPGILCGDDAVCVRDLASDSKNCGGCGVVCGAGKACSKGVCVDFVGYDESFTTGVLPVEQCKKWNTYRSTLSGSYTSITLSGTYAPSPGVSCTGPDANRLCNALRTGATTSVTCGGVRWYVRDTYRAQGVVVSTGDFALWVCRDVTNGVAPCTSAPYFSQYGFGGLGGSVCSQRTQTMRVECK